MCVLTNVMIKRSWKQTNIIWGNPRSFNHIQRVRTHTFGRTGSTNKKEAFQGKSAVEGTSFREDSFSCERPRASGIGVAHCSGCTRSKAIGFFAKYVRPTRSKEVRSATLEAARSSPRGGGRAPSGWASLWEYRAAQSRQARPEEPQPQSCGAAKGDTWSVL